MFSVFEITYNNGNNTKLVIAETMIGALNTFNQYMDYDENVDSCIEKYSGNILVEGKN